MILILSQIDTLSKVNHKNFVNLLGYCEEDVPFTRMIAFEYAPNGTLFEHLHSKYLHSFNLIVYDSDCIPYELTHNLKTLQYKKQSI